MSSNVWNELLYWLGVATAAAAGTGVLLSVPPFTLFIFPVYEQVHAVHGWVSLIVGGPFVVAMFAHGIPAWRARGFSYLTRTGLVLSGAFVAALASGWHVRFAAERLPWVMVVHFAGGILTAVTLFLHVRRWGGARRRGRKHRHGKLKDEKNG